MALCECGCGGTAPIRNYSSPGRGHFKGQPARFIVGHPTKNLPHKDYRYQRIDGVVIAEHRVRAAKALGRPLPKGVEVHHVDGTRGPESQLVICPNRAYHLLLHARMRIQKAGGNPNSDSICVMCKRLKPRSEFSPHSKKVFGVAENCRACMNAYQREWRKRKKD